VIRVLVIADSIVARAGLATRLAGDDRFEVIGQARAVADLERLVGVEGADVVVVEVRPDDDRAASALRALAAEGLSPPVVAVVHDEAGSWTGEALHAGVRAVLPVDVGANQLRAAIAAVAAGFVVMRPEDIPGGAGAAPARTAPPATEARLTPRELEVLGLLAEGIGNKGIATRLAISERTVKFHIAAIFDKLGVTSRTEAVTAGVRQGLISL